LKRKGFALIMALILMVIFFVVTVAFSTIVGYEFKTSKENQLVSKALYAADAGVQVGMCYLRSALNQIKAEPALWDMAGQYNRDKIIHQVVWDIFKNGLTEPMDMGDTYYGAYKLSLESMTVQKVIQSANHNYPVFNLYNLKLKAQGMVTNDIEVLAAKSLRVEILVNTYRAKCQIYRWYDAQ
jgi:hypothetical protein